MPAHDQPLKRPTSAMAVLFAIGFGAGIFSSCKTRKSESSLESQQEKFSAAAALEQVAQFTGRRTVDDWHLAGPDYENETDQRSDAARRGRDLWFFATGGNARFFHRTLPAKLGARIDWNRFLGIGRGGHDLRTGVRLTIRTAALRATKERLRSVLAGTYALEISVLQDCFPT